MALIHCSQLQPLTTTFRLRVDSTNFTSSWLCNFALDLSGPLTVTTRARPATRNVSIRSSEAPTRPGQSCLLDNANGYWQALGRSFPIGQGWLKQIVPQPYSRPSQSVFVFFLRRARQVSSYEFLSIYCSLAQRTWTCKICPLESKSGTGKHQKVKSP